MVDPPAPVPVVGVVVPPPVVVVVAGAQAPASFDHLHSFSKVFLTLPSGYNSFTLAD